MSPHSNSDCTIYSNPFKKTFVQFRKPFRDFKTVFSEVAQFYYNLFTKLYDLISFLKKFFSHHFYLYLINFVADQHHYQ